eukprot:TRINITY_DN29181_c0_g1_i1.p1 TRINITY_DN29181_c0_g1~~TRINITY_DN29181_c0_g1_i1.p1  ORF type:complete len:390 (-),score=65.36 TRINITY_DN29181_c0_g1_i1:358-1377(-)
MVAHLIGPRVRSKSIVHEGYVYASIDFTPPECDSIGSQTQWLVPPPGWDVAPDERDIAQSVIAPHNWGAVVLVVKSGTAYFTSGGQSPGYPWQTGQLDVLDALKPKMNPSYKPKSEYGRVLIRALSQSDRVTEHLWEMKQFTDCTVVCGGESTECHRAVLAAGSAVFNAMLQTGMKEGSEQKIEIKDASPQVVEAFLRFMYTGDLKVSPSDKAQLAEVLALANLYQVKELIALTSLWLVEDVTIYNVRDVTNGLRSLADVAEAAPAWRSLLEQLRDDVSLLDAVVRGGYGLPEVALTQLHDTSRDSRETPSVSSPKELVKDVTCKTPPTTGPPRRASVS